VIPRKDLWLAVAAVVVAILLAMLFQVLFPT
jgi:hypothetical protein